MALRGGREIGPRTNVASSGRGMRGHEGRRMSDAVGIDMLYRLFTIVLVERAVIVVVMRIVLQVQHDVRNAVPMVVRNTRVGDGERLPEQRDDQHDNGGRLAHAGNLADTHRTVEPQDPQRRREMLLIVTKYAVTAFLIVLVSELAKRSDKLGALIASLPLVTISVMIWLYMENQGTEKVARHAYYTFWYVLPTLPMFLLTPAMLDRGWNFWIALAAGLLITVVSFALSAVVARHLGVTLWP